MKLRRVLAASLLALIAVQPTVVAAQAAEQSSSPPIWRRLSLAGAGAALVGGAAAFGAKEQEGSLCGSKACIVSVAAVIGASAGYFIGQEMDLKAYRHSIEGPSLDFGLRTVELEETPIGMVGEGRGILTMSRNQVGMIDEDLRFTPLLSNVQPRAVTVLPGRDYLLVASNTALLGLPLGEAGMGADAERASTLFQQGATTLEPLSSDAVAMGSPGRIRRLSLERPGAAEATGEAESRGLPMGIKMSEGVLWSVEDSALVGRDPGTLRELGRASLPGQPRHLSLSGRTAVASMGADGACLVDVSHPGQPSVVGMVREMEFAYAAAMMDGRLYVAGGPQGIFVYDITNPGKPRAVGVARDIGFAGDVLVHDGRLFILDRERSEVHRADRLP